MQLQNKEDCSLKMGNAELKRKNRNSTSGHPDKIYLGTSEEKF